MGSESGLFFWQDEYDLYLIVTGRLTAAEAYSMYEHVESWLDGHPQSAVFIDLDQANYMDSTTIGTFIRLHKRQRQEGNSLYLCNPSVAVRQIIRQTRLDRYFAIVDNDTIRELEHQAFDRIPRFDSRRVDGRFVLDAHHNICEAVPELKPQFETLIKVLSEELKQGEQR